MPKVDIDYSNTIIYKITCNDETVTDSYVGHTTNFVQRKHAHKNSCLNDKSSTYNLKLYKTIRQYGGWSNWTMEIIHFCKCNDLSEARQKEQEYFKLLNANLNCIEPFQFHKKISTTPPIYVTETTNIQKCKKDTLKYVCSYCDFKCAKLSNYNIHLTTPKHSYNILLNENIKKNNYECEYCQKKYKSKSGLWYHSRVCEANMNECESDNDQEIHSQPITPQIDPNILLDIIKQNQELQKQMIEFMKTNTSINTNNTNCHNTNNNTFNLNMFLNEKCKDAININDFVDNIKMQLTDLENFGDFGYVEGVSRVLIKNLKELDMYSRPIHCSDLKREVLYIKDNNEWTKESDDKPVLKNMIKQVANKNIKQIQTWKAEYPDCIYSDSKKNDQYMNIVMNSMSGGTSEEQQNNLSQIVKNITKAVVIEKKII